MLQLGNSGSLGRRRFSLVGLDMVRNRNFNYDYKPGLDVGTTFPLVPLNKAASLGRIEDRIAEREKPY